MRDIARRGGWCSLAILLIGTHAWATDPRIPVYTSTDPTHALPGLTGAARPTIIVGNPNAPANPNAFGVIDGNTPDSVFAGVVSIYGALNGVNGVLGSGVVLDRTHILTAAHVVDFIGGISPTAQPTGDGIPDALIPNTRIYLNNTAAPEPYAVSAINVPSTWHGFNNVSAPEGPNTHDDLAVLTLSTPLPASVPSYPLYRTPFDQDTGKLLLFAGYGQGGDALNGVTAPATFEVKRWGWNITRLYEPDDETGTGAEVFLSDFDPSDLNGFPVSDKAGIDGSFSLGNDYESIIAPGDSGGPVFLIDDKNGDGFVDVDELTLFGLTTFTFDTPDGAWPNFGAAFGGTIVSAYVPFVQSLVPEPASLALLAPVLMMAGRRRQRR